MAYRVLFRNSHVGCLCKPINTYTLTNILALRKVNFTNVQSERKYKIQFIPLRCNTIKKSGTSSTKHFKLKPWKTLKSKLAEKDDDVSDYHRIIEEMNYGPHFGRRLNRRKFKKKYIRPSSLDEICKMCKLRNSYEMESYFVQMRNIDDDMNSSLIMTLSKNVAIPQEDIQQLKREIDMKNQNYIWKQSRPEILNNWNNKNETCKLIYGHKKGLKHELLKNLSTFKLVRTPEICPDATPNAKESPK